MIYYSLEAEIGIVVEIPQTNSFKELYFFKNLNINHFYQNPPFTEKCQEWTNRFKSSAQLQTGNGAFTRVHVRYR